ncbi:hypothetical protein ZIOFF_006817 [Zingiber officinale]|uniref:RNase III domain-containing protein n=1 Tax=Zingiber officinale TaxID=94328 RepID=A0A8J5HQ75_ZINOF|nr:hypothetical protein ZIOFF_006817 [Zingiber officinale]
MAAIAMAYSPVAVRASWDTNPIPKPPAFKPIKPARVPPPAPPPPPPATTAQSTSSVPSRVAFLEKDFSMLLNAARRSTAKKGKSDEQYLGLETWLPVAPKVNKPRSIYNAASLAYLGDCIYELYARRHFLYPPLSINEYNDRVTKVVRCEAQVCKLLLNVLMLTMFAAYIHQIFLSLLFYYQYQIVLSSKSTFTRDDLLLKKLLDEDYLTEEEREILRWGKNIVSSKTRTRKRVGIAAYNRASSFETLVGYLYLTNTKRLEEIMYKLGFLTGASTELITEELRANLRKKPTTSASVDGELSTKPFAVQY